MSAELYTCSWPALYRAHGARLVDVTTGVLPVRISRGTPKFWPAAEQFPAIEALMPDPWVLGKASREPEWDWTRAFRRKLHTIGIARIQAQLDELAELYCRPLVLLCFEADPGCCHRGRNGGFSQWYATKTGIEISELVFEQTIAPAGAQDRRLQDEDEY